MTMLIRPATKEDLPFLWEALGLAINWREGELHLTPEQVRKYPASSHYVAGWPHPGEAGFLALDTFPVGAAWWRFIPADDPGYGFVDASIPELAIAVLSGRRGEGVGTALLRRLIDEARSLGLPGLSLSVQLANPAIRLYEKFAFSVANTDATSATMVLALD